MLGRRRVLHLVQFRPRADRRAPDASCLRRSTNLESGPSVGRFDARIPRDHYAFGLQGDDAVLVKAQKGWVTLTGKVEWQYQKSAAADTVRDLAGVVGVSNQIEIKQRASAFDVKKRIEDALKRNAEIEAQAIKVNILDGGKVTLEGRVHAWSERSAAERAAWSAPGGNTVEDRLTIG